MTATELQQLGEELGLDAIGAAPAAAYEETERHIQERRARGLFADMKFTMAQPETSCHPETLLPGARTVISAAHCYWTEEPPLEAGEGRLARYTWYDGYAVLRERLDELGRRLGGSYRVLVDANQHVDREAAARSGVGFYGKNTMLITRRHGSWVVLGTLVTDVEIEPTPKLELDCGSCRLCIDACPTDALDEPGTLDSTRCLSYWTQAPAPIPDDFRAELGAQVYGCDICQDVCPWNRRARISLNEEFQPKAALFWPEIEQLLNKDETEWKEMISGTALRRAKVKGLLRNLMVVAGNSGVGEFRNALQKFLEHPEETVRSHAKWAIDKLKHK